MTVQEFSREFDLLFNNINSNASPGFNDYEKSVFLTQAQEFIVMELYKGNSEYFEKTEAVRRYLDPLIITNTQSTQVIVTNAISTNSQCFAIPDNVMYITYEEAKLEYNESEKTALVKPVTQDEYYKVINNPFKGPNLKRVLRLEYGNNGVNTEDCKVELISPYHISKYSMRYLRKPKPIILTDLSSYSLTINNMSTVSECELHENLHRIILNRAGLLAKQAWLSNNNIN